MTAALTIAARRLRPAKSSPPRSLPILPLGAQQDRQQGIGPEYILTLPGSQVPLLTLDLPAALRGQAREQVARRQVADRTGLSQDSLTLRPFVPRLPAPTSGPKAAGWTRVLAADPQDLQALQGLNCRAVLPDYLTLPCTTGLWSLHYAEPSSAPEHPALLQARLGPEDGFTALPALGLAMLQQALASADPAPRALLLQGPLPEDLRRAVHALAAPLDLPVITDPQAALPLGLKLPQVLGHGELDCDLRHNPMAARNRLATQVLPWRWPLMGLTLAATLWATAQMIQIERLEGQQAAATARSMALTRRHFIPSGPVLDARLQISRALQQMRQDQGGATQLRDPLELTARVAHVLQEVGLRPDLLNYQLGSGLLLALRVPDFAAADHLANALRQAELTVTLTQSQVSESGGGVAAEFVITPAATAGETRP